MPAAIYHSLPLSLFSLLMLLTVLALLIMMRYDKRQILGVSRWLKPLKFAASIMVFCATLVFLLEPLVALRPQTVGYCNWLVTAFMALEIICITMQSARNTTSHFNNTTPLNIIVFALMGLSIVCNTVLMGWLCYCFAQPVTGLADIIRQGILLGTATFVLASLEGFAMVNNMGHTVGAADGGEGLALVNWSTRAGDLRIAHFVGMHALQVLPLFALVLSSALGNDSAAGFLLLYIFAGLYLMVSAGLFIQALRGRPLIRKSAKEVLSAAE